MAEVTTFGEWLKRRRGVLGLTQEQLAQQVGCSTIALRKIEAEERRPSEAIVDRLAEVFNIVPAERAALLKFARGDWRTAPTSLSEEAPWRATRTTPRSNLPAATTSLIGRDSDIAALRSYLAQAEIHLVTLIGPPGIGKTRLSMAAAREALADFPEGVFFIALAPLDQADLVALTLMQTLGFVVTGHQSAFERVKGGIGDKHLLLVLDNVEHLIEETAPLVVDLLSACPQLKILATSREALRVPGELLCPVSALNIPTTLQLRSLALAEAAHFAAVQLFAERARAVRPDFALNTDNLPTVAAICTRLDGLPLAIELIASRIRLMSPQDLSARLTSDFKLHADGMRGVPARQKTLHNAIAWSYDLLNREEQVLFARLAVFAGGFTLETVQTIIPLPGVINAVMALLDKSLLVRTIDAQGAARFDQLEMIRDFARDRLREHDEEAEARNWHLAYFLELAEQADSEIHGSHQVEWMNRMGKEIDNFRAALEWCVADQNTKAALCLLGALSWLWIMEGHDRELCNWFNKIRALPGVDAHPALYGKLLTQIGHAQWLTDDYRAARSVLEESRAIWLQLGAAGERGLAETLIFLGVIAQSYEADYKAAQVLFDRSCELYQQHSDQWGVAFASLNLGVNADMRNDHSSALFLLQQNLDQFQRLGDMWGMGRSLENLAELFLKQGNYEKARLLSEQHLMVDGALHFKQGTVVALRNLGESYRHQGDNEQATHYYEKSLMMSREYDDTWGLATSAWGLGLVALHQNDYRLARQQFIDYYHLARALYVRKLSTCDLLTSLAAVAGGTNQPERTARLCGAARAMLETTDYRISPFDQTEFDRHIQVAHEQLGEAVFETLAAEGRALTLEQAIELALQG